MTAAGYEFIGMDHFAKPDNELAVALRTGALWRNFQGFTTKAGRGGRGLGLFVCRRMLAEQGAALLAERGPEGRGLRMTVRLPVA